MYMTIKELCDNTLNHKCMMHSQKDENKPHLSCLRYSSHFLLRKVVLL